MMISFFTSKKNPYLLYLSSYTWNSFIYFSETGINGVFLNSSIGLKSLRNLCGCSFSIDPGTNDKFLNKVRFFHQSTVQIQSEAFDQGLHILFIVYF